MPEKILLQGKDRAVVVIAAGAVFICLTMGVRQSFGLYLAPFTEDLGALGIGAFSFAVGLQNIMWGIAAPLFGMVADRRGPVGAAATGGALYVCGMLLMSSAADAGGFILAQCFIGFGIAGAGFSVILGAAGKVAPPAHRSMILAIVTAAGSFGQFALVPVAQYLLEWLGPRGSLQAQAGILVLLVLLAPLLRLPPEAPRAAGQNGGGGVLRCAFGSRGYVLLNLGFFVCGFQLVFIATHLPKYAADSGVGESAAAWALAMVGLFNIFGTLACGWLGGRFAKKSVLSVFYLLRSAVIVLFLIVPLTSVSVVVFGALMGLLWLGTVPLTSGLISVFFGVRHLSMLYGVTFFMHQAGSFLGAWLGGRLYNAFGNYDIMWASAALLGVVAALLHWPIREREDATFARSFA
ncbi:MAG: MFS transporter [Gammaproteobacteria bacterium]